MAKKKDDKEYRRRRTRVIKVTNTETHHYFVRDLKMEEAMKDDQGRIMVFTTRERALQEADARKWSPSCVVGMGDRKWKLFQTEQPHIVVET